MLKKYKEKVFTTEKGTFKNLVQKELRSQENASIFKLNNSLSVHALQKQNFNSHRKSFQSTQRSKQKLYQYLIQSSLVNKNDVIISQQIEESDPKQIEKELILDKQMNETKEIWIHDKMEKGLAGKQSVNRYYKHYKKLQKIKDQNKLHKTQQSGYTAILKKCKKLKALPCCLGLIKDSGSQNQLKINNFKIGDTYAQILSQGLNKQSNINQYKMSCNRITSKGASAIFKRVSEKAKKIDFSNNSIVYIDQSLFKALTSRNCALQYLNLQANKLSEATVKELLSILCENYTLRYLNLSQNNLSNNIVQNLCQMMHQNDQIQEIYLRWVTHVYQNNIYSDAAIRIFEILQRNQKIKVFDISYNRIGGNSVTAICNFITNNKTIAHLDLSSNNFTIKQCQEISKALKVIQSDQKNHSIYGFHFIGNFGYIDPKGFLVINQEEKKVKNINRILMSYKIDSFKIKSQRKRHKTDTEKMKNVCWICQGWTQFQYQYDIENQQDQCWIHLGFNGDNAKLMKNEGLKAKYLTMIPPGCNQFFFTVNQYQTVSNKYPCQTFLQNIKKKITIGQSQKFINIEDRNFHQVDFGISINQKENIKCKPRIADLQPGKKKKQKKIWSYPISIWAKQWKKQDEDTTKKCFQRDWSHSKISKLVKNIEDQQKVRNLLQKHYKLIKFIYKYFAALSPVGGNNPLLDVWCITSNVFTEFCNLANLIDVNLPLKFIDLTFIKTTSISAVDWRGNFRNPQRGLVRYQFMQSLVRLAEQKFINGGTETTFFPAVIQIIQHLLPMRQKYDSEAWRQKRYFVQQNDMLIKQFKAIFQQVYKKYSKLKVKPGQKPFMSADQFKSVCIAVQLVNGKYQCIERDSSVCYNLAMMTQIDQLQSDRIMRMTLIEFIQGIARIADIASPPSITNINSDISRAQRQKNPLWYKFEWAIYKLIHRICNQDTRQAYPIPSTSKFDLQIQSD